MAPQSGSINTILTLPNRLKTDSQAAPAEWNGAHRKPDEKCWAVESAGVSSDAGGVTKKTEVDESRVGPEMWLTTLLSTVGVARVAD
jgi:hypothetical protein